MDIASENRADGSIVFTVVLTPDDTLRLPNTIRALDGATSCAEMLLSLALIAMEMQQRQGEFVSSLREATTRKALRRGPHIPATESNPAGVERRFGLQRRQSWTVVSVDRRAFATGRRTGEGAWAKATGGIPHSPTNPLAQDKRKERRRLTETHPDHVRPRLGNVLGQNQRKRPDRRL